MAEYRYEISFFASSPEEVSQVLAEMGLSAARLAGASRGKAFNLSGYPPTPDYITTLTGEPAPTAQPAAIPAGPLTPNGQAKRAKRSIVTSPAGKPLAEMAEMDLSPEAEDPENPEPDAVQNSDPFDDAPPEDAEGLEPAAPTPADMRADAIEKLRLAYDIEPAGPKGIHEIKDKLDLGETGKFSEVPDERCAEMLDLASKLLAAVTGPTATVTTAVKEGRAKSRAKA